MRYFIIIVTLMVIHLYAKDIAIVKSVKGEVILKTSQSYERVRRGELLNTNMILITKDDSSVTLIFQDNSVVVLGPNSILNLKSFHFEPLKKEFDFKLYLKKGSISFESGKIGELSPESFELKTPDASVAIRGTKFYVKVVSD